MQPQRYIPDLERALAWRFPLTPDAPAWGVDWTALCGRLSWLRALGGAVQDAEHHAEGDVLVHTGMVAQALAGLAGWRALGEQERTLLFAAALLHDVAKPQCTVVEAEGRISTRGHARKGEQIARALLWTGQELDAAAPFPWRERVARLVRYHGLPLWFLERDDPERALIAASQLVPLDQLALLAEADALGRSCRDQQRLLDTIGLFRELSGELGCAQSPYQFASDHSRYLYFQRPHLRPDYQAYDDTRFEVVLLCGLPAAGKDTWCARQLPGWPVIALDDIRRELKVAPTDNQGAVLERAQQRALGYLRTRQGFIWNGTSITLNRRRQLVDLFSAYGARVRLVYLEAPLWVLLRRNAQRDQPVPEKVVRGMLARLDIPDASEAQRVEWWWGHDE